jgi:hypothetical protein
VMMTRRYLTITIVTLVIAATTMTTFSFAQPVLVLPTYSVGLLYSASGNLAGVGNQTLRVIRLWRDLVNRKPELGFRIKLVLGNIQSSAALVVPRSTELLAANVSFFIAPEGTLTLYASGYGNLVKVPVMSRVSATSLYKCGNNPALWPAYSNCLRPNSRAFSYAATVLQPAGVQFRDYYALTRAQGASTASIVYFDDDFHTETCTTGAYYASVNKIKIVSSNIILANYTDSSLRSIVSNLQRLNPDVVTWCRRLGCAQDVAVMKSMGYLPRSLMMVQCTDTAALIATYGGNDMKYINGVLFWTSQLSGPAYTDDPTTPYASHFIETDTQPSPLRFQSWFLNATGTLPTYTDASTFAVGYMIETALFTAPTTDPPTLAETLGRINIASFWGTLSLDQVGMSSSNAIAVTQVDASLKLQLLSPTSAATSQLIYPMPTWAERTYSSSYGASSGAQIVIAVMVVCVVVYIIAIIIVWARRKNPLVRSLNPSLITVSFIGAILTSLAQLTWLDDNTHRTCAARLPMFIIGLSLLIVRGNMCCARLQASWPISPFHPA